MTAPYVLGHADTELKRLMEQGRFYGELTEDIFRRAGLAQGMNVLDVGCGAGDVSFVAASIVGPEGSVLGIDKSPEAVKIAAERATRAGLPNVRFELADLEFFRAPSKIDALVGRLVLLYLADAAGALRRLVEQIRDGGIVAFVEMELSSVRAVPPLPLFATCVKWLRETFTRAGAEIDMGSRLHATFQKAGLPEPSMLMLGRVEAGPRSPVYENLSQTIRTLLPAMERFEVAKAAEVDIDTLADRLREEAVRAGAVLIPPCAIGAWARLPG